MIQLAECRELLEKLCRFADDLEIPSSSSVTGYRELRRNDLKHWLQCLLAKLAWADGFLSDKEVALYRDLFEPKALGPIIPIDLQLWPSAPVFSQFLEEPPLLLNEFIAYDFAFHQLDLAIDLSRGIEQFGLLVERIIGSDRRAMEEICLLLGGGWSNTTTASHEYLDSFCRYRRLRAERVR